MYECPFEVQAPVTATATRKRASGNNVINECGSSQTWRVNASFVENRKSLTNRGGHPN